MAIVEDGVEFGLGVIVREFAIVRRGVKLGDRVKVGNYTILCGAPLEIGEGTRLNAFVYISNGTTIGKNCFIGPKTATLNTRFPQAANPAFSRIDSVVIEDDVKIGAACLILPGVTIGHDAFVAAGSLVTRSIPPYAVVMGTPARIVGDVRDLPAYQGESGAQ